jgi:hypothetical protein
MRTQTYSINPNPTRLFCLLAGDGRSTFGALLSTPPSLHISQVTGGRRVAAFDQPMQTSKSKILTLVTPVCLFGCRRRALGWWLPSTTTFGATRPRRNASGSVGATWCRCEGCVKVGWGKGCEEGVNGVESGMEG